MKIELDSKTVLYIVIAIIFVNFWSDLRDVANSFIKASAEPEQVQQPQMFMMPSPGAPRPSQPHYSPNSYAGK